MRANGRSQVAMGGLYGNAAATALEDVPEKARGIVSGMLQQGYAFARTCQDDITRLAATILVRSMPPSPHHHLPAVPTRDR